MALRNGIQPKSVGSPQNIIRFCIKLMIFGLFILKCLLVQMFLFFVQPVLHVSLASNQSVLGKDRICPWVSRVLLGWVLMTQVQAMFRFHTEQTLSVCVPCSSLQGVNPCLSVFFTAAGPVGLPADDPSGQTSRHGRRSVHPHEGLLKGTTFDPWPLTCALYLGGLSGQYMTFFTFFFFKKRTIGKAGERGMRTNRFHKGENFKALIFYSSFLL